MRIRWTSPALRHLAEHIRYIASHDPDAAERVKNAIITAVERLTAMPHRGRLGQRPGTRELVITRYPAYIVVYRVTETEIRVLYVWHGRQDWQRAMEEYDQEHDQDDNS